jgi:hypothetical protein
LLEMALIDAIVDRPLVAEQVGLLTGPNELASASPNPACRFPSSAVSV